MLPHFYLFFFKLIFKLLAMPCGMFIPQPGIEPRSPALLLDSLPAYPQGKPYDMLGKTNFFSTKIIYNCLYNVETGVKNSVTFSYSRGLSFTSSKHTQLDSGDYWTSEWV